jgi:hypothetical protein
MKTLLLLFLVSLVAAMPGQPAFAAVPAVPEGFVKLEITGTSVNIRPIPDPGGQPVAQANPGDLFIAEQWPVENTADHSRWYRIAFALKADGSMTPLTVVDEGQSRAVFPFIHASFASISPVTAEEYARASALPYREDFSYDLGTSLPDLVGKFGPGEVNRSFNMEELQSSGLSNMLFTTLALPGLDGFLLEPLEGPYRIMGQHFTLTRPGHVFRGFAIATPGFGREEVRAQMEKEWPDRKPDISTGEEGERWYYSAEMWNCTFIFDGQGLVKRFEFFFDL